jgi:hypothetical protein
MLSSWWPSWTFAKPWATCDTASSFSVRGVSSWYWVWGSPAKERISHQEDRRRRYRINGFLMGNLPFSFQRVRI